MRRVREATQFVLYTAAYQSCSQPWAW
uniref:Uncharacterized protein n=1 Tax=Anguilla anguilla TaxID=7936 RepID=A0A0E9USV0_ANGAN